MTTGHLSVLKAGESAVRTIRVEGSVPTALAIADAGDVAYASMQNGSVIVLSMDATTQKNIKCDQSEIFALYAVEGGAQAIGASANGVLCLVSQGGSVIKRVPTTAAMAFAASRELGAVAIAGVDGVVRLFNSKLESIAEFNGHRGSVNSLHFTIDGRILYSGGEDETLRAWSAANAASIRTGSWHPPKMSDIELRDLYKELPGLWPLLRRLGYI
jgi:WD40 repeat protein